MYLARRYAKKKEGQYLRMVVFGESSRGCMAP
jgi:hypothetical protein